MVPLIPRTFQPIEWLQDYTLISGFLLELVRRRPIRF